VQVIETAERRWGFERIRVVILRLAT